MAHISHINQRRREKKKKPTSNTHFSSLSYVIPNNPSCKCGSLDFFSYFQLSMFLFCLQLVRTFSNPFQLLLFLFLRRKKLNISKNIDVVVWRFMSLVSSIIQYSAWFYNRLTHDYLTAIYSSFLLFFVVASFCCLLPLFAYMFHSCTVKDQTVL